MSIKRRLQVLIAAGVLPASLASAGPIAYPAKGQSAQQQQKDEGACYSWAKSNTGVDPTKVTSAPPPSVRLSAAASALAVLRAARRAAR